MILITGATGTVGREVVKQLSEKGINFRALVHSPKKASLVDRRGAEINFGDYSNTESLDIAMRDIDQVFILCPSGPKQLESEGNIA